MKQTEITGNGVTLLTIDHITRQDEVSIYVPAAIGGAVITIGWVDEDVTFNPYDSGAMLAGKSLRVACGQGVRLSASITGFTVPFKIGYAD